MCVKVATMMSNEINNQKQNKSFYEVNLYAQGHFFKCKITIIIVGNFETILSANVTQEKQFQKEYSFGLAKHKDVCIKIHGL